MANKHDELEAAGQGENTLSAAAAALGETLESIEQKKQLFSLPSALDTEIGELRRIQTRLVNLATAAPAPEEEMKPE